jgi:hypothetical protein
MTHKYAGFTDTQLDALLSVVALVLNDPTWPHEKGQERALQGAFTALSNAKG